MVVLPVAADRGARTVTAAAGSNTFRLLDAMAYNPALHRDQTMYVRGLLITVPGERRLTISAFEMLTPSCRK